MKHTLIKNARMVNEGSIRHADIQITNEYISLIADDISARPTDEVVDAKGAWVLPGMIDDQVHFREPGLTHKGNIASESRAAVAGGITSYMEMPNVNPATTSIEALEKKFAIGQEKSFANYSFYLGATEHNLEEIKKIDPSQVCGLKVFMGASTGNLLVEEPQALEAIFKHCPSLIVTHCESGPVMEQNAQRYKDKGVTPTIFDHPILRDDKACYASSSYAVDLAKRNGTQLHVLHITTAKELSLFEKGPIEGKQITAEACVHHLWFSQEDYQEKGNLIKCNPAIKSADDRAALIEALKTGQIDIIATDHAPHTFAEKQVDYNQAPAGLPLVEHALISLIDHVHAGRMTIEQVVQKVCHNPAIRYQIDKRGYIKEGYFADLVLVDPEGLTAANHSSVRYLCQWTPFDGHTFKSKVLSTWVNGSLVYDGQDTHFTQSAKRLAFLR
ncbi:dihydroorotase [Catenovulum sp. SM1970]|uniref:dihydroorotase n=1 Tax=Marinifaba aquimaris TaxID=2741323 RepID=UPI001572CE17|nr:dihydroorotase [Marinifaba aquimaris]NTS78198.1 dihydroorotase [Marinifaba aquimaris]